MFTVHNNDSCQNTLPHLLEAGLTLPHTVDDPGSLGQVPQTKMLMLVQYGHYY